MLGVLFVRIGEAVGRDFVASVTDLGHSGAQIDCNPRQSTTICGQP
jgi:hypothetical protein